LLLAGCGGSGPEAAQTTPPTQPTTKVTTSVTTTRPPASPAPGSDELNRKGGKSLEAVQASWGIPEHLKHGVKPQTDSDTLLTYWQSSLWYKRYSQYQGASPTSFQAQPLSKFQTTTTTKGSGSGSGTTASTRPPTTTVRPPSTTTTTRPSTTTTTLPPSTTTTLPPIGIVTLAWGETAENGPLWITVQTPVVDEDVQGLPEDKQLVKVDVALRNVSEQTQEYSAVQFFLQDETNYIYQGWYFDTDEPYLVSGALAPGREVRGFVGFVLPQGAVAKSVLFMPGPGWDVNIWE